MVIQNTNLVYSHLITREHCSFVITMAKEGKLIVGSTYTASRFNFEDTLQDWQHLITQREFFICGDDFNASSTLWDTNKTAAVEIPLLNI